jgi:hypothetical protein
MIMCSNLYIPADLNQGLRSVDKWEVKEGGEVRKKWKDMS